ncbi:TetR family transcriptional regulator [Kitasatospora sp. SolWspMP-SS2h]|uniref:ScbR family autoregulator-binding transcription factor n=1 Tax=Kitasatospora sp. SolWspMP-SS2h TaxID=1305729 RepID=UPI000DB98038|nr:ScbR family autoregulator-binding transcription factor [Kitasatospora sp. SolWspMP-SS2h]RAJ36145.1 TetR family transcriptional regulator [Kitasatospora sp. SolWspMP-SS2h]
MAERRPRQERAEQTQRALVEAAAEVFAAHGYTGTNLGRICELAGTSKGALYFHFATKDDLAAAVVAAYQRSVAELSDRLLAEDPASPMGRLVELSYEFAIRLREDALTRAAARLSAGSAPDPRDPADFAQGWLELARELLVRAQRSGELRDGVAPAAIGSTVLAVSYGMRLLEPDRDGVEDRLAESWDLLLPGLVSDEVLERLGASCGMELTGNQSASRVRPERPEPAASNG